jgi:ABC-2 type transport system ATP-binding protein
VLLDVRNLTKEYRKGVRANDDISMTTDGGEVLGLFGHNGAGKTTLLNQIAGLTRPTSGWIRVDGHDPVADPAAARRVCSLQPQSQAPLDGITPRQAIEILARIRGARRRRARERAAELIAALQLEEWADTVGEKLSGGVRRLTAFCMAAAEPGRLVMFDEPTNDVDPVRRRLLWTQIRALAEAGCAVLLVTHNVVEAERGVDRLLVLDRGRVVARGTPAQLRARHGDRLRLELQATEPADAERLANDPAIAGWRAGAATVSGRRVVVPIEAPAAAVALGWAQAQRAAAQIEEFAVTPTSLEDVYLTLVGADTDDNTDRDQNREGREASDASLAA